MKCFILISLSSSLIEQNPGFNLQVIFKLGVRKGPVLVH
jgi:hypothetical protein